MGPQRLFLTLRPTMKASTCSMQVTPAQIFLAIIDSSRSSEFALTVPRPLPAATSLTCCTLLISFTRKNTSWKMVASSSH